MPTTKDKQKDYSEGVLISIDQPMLEVAIHEK
jgi:hypothetical protein